MRDLAAGTHWALAGARGEYAAGNGAAMRIAPLAFLLDPGQSGDRTLIRDICRITHHHDEAYVGALAVVLAIRAVLTGAWSQECTFLEAVVGDLPDSSVRDRIEQLIPMQLPAREVAIRLGATGYVVDTVPLALYCAQFVTTQSLPEVLVHAISGGGDTDTIASIAGQVAGCVAGEPGIRSEHFANLVGADEIFLVAERFSDFVVERKSPR